MRLLSTERLRQHDLRLLPKANEAVDPRRQRRALTEDELSRLLAAAERPVIEAMTVRDGLRKGQLVANARPETLAVRRRLGQERALISKTLAFTGLRRNELRSLTVADLDLIPGQEALHLSAKAEKNRKGSVLPLRGDLAAELRQWIKTNGLKGSDRLLLVPVNLSQNLDRDLVLAGIPNRDDRGRMIDVHSLRHTFATRLAQAGIPMRLAQAGLRHSDPRLTAVTYTDERLLNVREAVERISPIPQATERQNGSQLNSVARTVAGNGVPNGQNLSVTDKRNGASNSQSLPSVSSKTAEKVNKNYPVSSSGSVGHQLNSSEAVDHFTCLVHKQAIT